MSFLSIEQKPFLCASIRWVSPCFVGEMETHTEYHHRSKIDTRWWNESPYIDVREQRSKSWAHYRGQGDVETSTIFVWYNVENWGAVWAEEGTQFQLSIALLTILMVFCPCFYFLWLALNPPPKTPAQHSQHSNHATKLSSANPTVMQNSLFPWNKQSLKKCSLCH